MVEMLIEMSTAIANSKTKFAVVRIILILEVLKMLAIRKRLMKKVRFEETMIKTACWLKSLIWKSRSMPGGILLMIL